jgi:hypothetical protein
MWIMTKGGGWRKETKEECMAKEDIEGKFPCEKCWAEILKQVSNMEIRF